MSPGNTNAIEFKTSSGALPKFTATIDAGQEGTYPMEWTLPAASGTLALSTHSHGNITNDGRIGTAANRVIVTGTGGVLIAKAAGTTSQFFRGDGNWATPTASDISGLGSLALKSSLSPNDIPTLPYTKITFPQAPGDLLITSPQGDLGTISQANLLSGLALSTHTHGNITNDGRIGSAANRVIVTDTNGKLIAKDAGTTSQFLRGDGLWATPPTVDTTQDYTWTGLHSFKSSIRFAPNTATYYLAAPETGSGTVELPYNKSGTIALTSDIPDVVYGYCNTSASTTAKVVSSNTFTSHKAGQIYVIEFVNGNTATSPTININSTGAIGVRHLTTNGAVTTSPGTAIMYARSRTIWTFVYNGTYLIPIGKSTRYGNALETKMLSYSKGSSSSAITTSDTVSSAIGKLEYRLDNLSISNISGLQTALDAKVDKASFSLSGTTLTITV